VAPTIRSAVEADTAAIAVIYEHYVRRTWAAFHLEPPTIEDWTRLLGDAARASHPFLVSEAGGDLIGFAYGSSFRPRPAYSHTVETTVYVAREALGRGLGRPLYTALLVNATDRGFHSAVAGITLPNRGSITLHESLGFEVVGTFAEVGYKLGRWCDVQWWQKRLA